MLYWDTGKALASFHLSQVVMNWLLGSPLQSPAITTLSHKHGARTNENRSDKNGGMQEIYRCIVQHGELCFQGVSLWMWGLFRHCVWETAGALPNRTDLEPVRTEYVGV